MAEADPHGRHAGARGDAGHGEAHEVVADSEPEDFLGDASGCLAAQRLLALEGVGLHFVEAKFEFPALVVEGDQLRGGIGDGIE